MNEGVWDVSGRGAVRHSRGEGVCARRDGARGRRLQHLGLRHHHVELTCSGKKYIVLHCVAGGKKKALESASLRHSGVCPHLPPA